MMVVAADRQFEPRRHQLIARVAPIQPRVHHEDLDPAVDEEKETDGDDPMCTAHPARVPMTGSPRDMPVTWDSALLRKTHHRGGSSGALERRSFVICDGD